MRKLNTQDLFAFCRMLKKVGIKEEIRKIAEESDTLQDVWGAGFDLIYNMFDIITEKKGEKELYGFLAGPFECNPEEVEAMDLADFLAKCKQLALENDLPGFFKSAASSMK